MRILFLAVLLFAVPAYAGKAGFIVNYDPYYVPEHASTYSTAPYSVPAEMMASPETFIVGEPQQQAPVAQAVQPVAPKADTWRARKGETVEQVLERWASRENINLVWNAAQNKKLGKDFSHFGEFSSAVDKLLSDEGMGGIKRNYMNESEVTGGVGLFPPAVQSEPIMQDATSFQPQAAALPLLPELPVTEIAPMPMSDLIGAEDPIPAIESWTAAEGEPLLSVLRRWAAQGNVQFYSRARDIFAVRKAVSYSGTFAEAVQLLLDQYEKNTPRPTGQLYRSARPGTQGGQGAADVLVLEAKG